MAMMVGLLVLAVVGSPLALAGGEDQLWQCDNTVAEIILGIVRNVPAFVDAIISQSERAAGKTKCSALHALGICSDESLPGAYPYSTGGLSANQHVHAHRDLCYEYYFVHPTCGNWTVLDPDPASPYCFSPSGVPCPAGTKLEHRTAPGGGDHRHTCVLVTEGFPLPYS